MSFRLMSFAWGVALDATIKIVLLKMADHAHEDGGSIYPSIPSLARVCGLSERSIQRAITSLVQDSGLIRAKGFDPLAGEQFSSWRSRQGRPIEYLIDIDRLRECTDQGDRCQQVIREEEEPVTESHPTGDTASPVPVPHSHPPVTESHPTGDTASPKPINEPIIEPSEEPTIEPSPATRAGRKRPAGELTGDLRRDFEEWYDAYPIHKARGDAEKAYAKACKTASAGTLLEAARRYGDEQKAKGKLEFAKHPATWLNKKCWLDEPDPQQERSDYDPFGARRQGESVGGSASDLFQFGQQPPRAQKPSVIDIGREAYRAHEGREP